MQNLDSPKQAIRDDIACCDMVDSTWGPGAALATVLQLAKAGVGYGKLVVMHVLVVTWHA